MCSLVDDGLECNTVWSGRRLSVLWPPTRLHNFTSPETAVNTFHCDKLNPQTVCQWYQPLDNPLIDLLYCSLVVRTFSVFYSLYL